MLAIDARIASCAFLVAACQCVRVGAGLQWILGIAMILYASFMAADQDDGAMMVCIVAALSAWCATTAWCINNSETVSECLMQCVLDAWGSILVAGVGIMYTLPSSSKERAVVSRVLACAVGPVCATMLGGSNPIHLAASYGVVCALFESDGPLWRRQGVATKNAAPRAVSHSQYFTTFEEEGERSPVVGSRAAALLWLLSLLSPALATLASEGYRTEAACRAIATAAFSRLVARAGCLALSSSSLLSRDAPWWWCGNDFVFGRRPSLLIVPLVLTACERSLEGGGEAASWSIDRFVWSIAAFLTCLRLCGFDIRGSATVTAAGFAAGCLDFGLARFALIAAIAKTRDGEQSFFLASTLARVARLYTTSHFLSSSTLSGAAIGMAAFVLEDRTLLAASISAATFTMRDRSPHLIAACIARLALVRMDAHSRAALRLLVICLCFGDLSFRVRTPVNSLAVILAMAPVLAHTLTSDERSSGNGGLLGLYESTGKIDDFFRSTKKRLALRSAAALGAFIASRDIILLSIAQRNCAGIVVAAQSAIEATLDVDEDRIVPRLSLLCWGIVAFSTGSASAAFAAAAIICGSLGYECATCISSAAFVGCATGSPQAALAIAGPSSTALYVRQKWTSGLLALAIGFLSGSPIVRLAAGVTATLVALRERIYDEGTYGRDAASLSGAFLITTACFPTHPALAVVFGSFPLFLLRRQDEDAGLATLTNEVSDLRPDAHRRLAPYILSATFFLALSLARGPDLLDAVALFLGALPSHASAWARIAKRGKGGNVAAAALWPLSLAPLVLCQHVPEKLFSLQAAVSSGAILVNDLPPI